MATYLLYPFPAYVLEDFPPRLKRLNEALKDWGSEVIVDLGRFGAETFAVRVPDNQLAATRKLANVSRARTAPEFLVAADGFSGAGLISLALPATAQLKSFPDGDKARLRRGSNRKAAPSSATP